MEFIEKRGTPGVVGLVYEDLPPIDLPFVLSDGAIMAPKIGYVVLLSPREKYLATNGLAIYDLLELDGDTFSKNNYPGLYTYLGTDTLELRESPHVSMKYYILADLHD